MVGGILILVLLVLIFRRGKNKQKKRVGGFISASPIVRRCAMTVESFMGGSSRLVVTAA